MIFSLFLGILFAPVLLGIAVMIRMESKGPVFFIQERLGKDGKVFNIYKFRTMVDDAINQGTGIRTYERDPRITKVGAFLRKTSLDELPQLLNIFRNEMSFVGPRPPVPYHPRRYEEYNEFQRKRFTVRPGLTGLAQSVLRNGASWDRRIESDVMYVENMSLVMDIRVILLTIQTLFRHSNIYS